MHDTWVCLTATQDTTADELHLPLLTLHSYVAIGAYDDARTGEEAVPVGFLVAQISALPAAASSGDAPTASTSGRTAVPPLPAALSRRQRQKERKAEGTQLRRLGVEEAARLLRSGSASAGALVLSVYYVGVDFEYRRQGIGQQLLEHARDIGDAAG